MWAYAPLASEKVGWIFAGGVYGANVFLDPVDDPGPWLFALCPAWWHTKHNPFFMWSACS